MKRLWIFFVLLLAAAPLLSAQQNLAVPCGSKLFIEPMQGNLDQYLRARIVEQHIPVTIVMSKESADLVMSGSSQEYQDHWYAATRDKNTGAITIADKSGKFLWSGSAGDRNIWWGNLAKHGPEKVAERIVGKLKTAMQGCLK